MKAIKHAKGGSAALFKLKELVVGRKKVEIEAVTMKDPNTHKTLFKKEEIKTAALDYCANLLANRSPLTYFKLDKDLKDAVHESRMRIA